MVQGIRDTEDWKEKLSSEWNEGVWLGHQRSSNEALAGTTQGVERAYSVKRREPEQRWDKEAINAMVVTPQQPDPTRPGAKIPMSELRRGAWRGACAQRAPEKRSPSSKDEVPPELVGEVWLH